MLSRLSLPQIGNNGALEVCSKNDTEKLTIHESFCALYPGTQLTQEKTPELWLALRKSVDTKRIGITDPYDARKIAMWSRLLDEEKAYDQLKKVLKPVGLISVPATTQGGTYPNLISTNSPFAITGNVGIMGGINEMLLQSHDKKIHLLPALPSAWKDGAIRGFRARGGFELAMTWRNGRLKALAVWSKRGNPCILHYRGKEVVIKTEGGKLYRFNGDLELTI